MKKAILIIVFGFLFSGNANASRAECINVFGTVYCSPPGGGAVNVRGKPYCGLGQCIIVRGTAYCSSQKDGSALNIRGKAKCTGGCVRAQPSLCKVME